MYNGFCHFVINYKLHLRVTKVHIYCINSLKILRTPPWNAKYVTVGK